MGPSASTEVMPEETFAVATAAVTTTMARTGYYATGYVVARRAVRVGSG